MEQSLKKVKGNELLDLLENTGVIQEANRTFFHPIGMNLKLESDLTLSLESTDDEKGIILHTVDKFKTQIFNQFRINKHTKRQQKTGFIIQTKDMIRSDKLETSVVPPNTLKLNLLLTELDNFAFEIKKSIMTASKEKDENLNDFNEEDLVYNIHMKVQKGNLIHAAAYSMMAERIDKINNKLKEIREIRDKQNKIYKEKGVK